MPKLIIDDSNWKSFQPGVKQSDGSFRYGGLKPRSTHPQYGKMMAFADVDIPMIPLEEWPDRIADMTRRRAWAKDVMVEGGAKIRDQNGLGYCHCYSAILGIEVARLSMGLPYVELCPESVGGPITGWRNQGAWIVDDLMQVAKYGACEKSFQPRDHDISPSDWKDGWKENGLKYRAIEWQEGRSRDWQQQGSVILAGFGTPNGLNYWGHSVYDCWIEDLHTELHFSARDRYGFGFANSWDVTWGDHGFGIRTQSKMPSDEWYVLRQIVAG